MADLYSITKGKAYSLACIVSGRNNAEAKTEGFKDVFDLIMSDSGRSRQAHFLLQLTPLMAEGHRKILLDGLAREYAGLDGWM